MSVYTDFVRDYNNMNLTGHDVRRIHGLNSKQYSNLRNEALNNGDIPEHRLRNYEGAKYYHKLQNGNLRVKKVFGDETIYIGDFKDETTAKIIVESCKNVDWDVDKVSDVIEANKIKPKNYSLVNGYYIISKYIKGVNKTFACIHKDLISEYTVQCIVNRFRECNWNYTIKNEILKEFNL